MNKARGFLSLRRSVRSKLIAMVLATNALALLIGGIALLTHDLTVYRESWAADLATQASIIALSTAPALAFDDRSVAERNLSALQARRDVLSAALYQPDGTLYAQFARDDLPPQRLELGEGTYISGGEIEIVHRIARNREWLGNIYLRGQYDVAGRVAAYVSILAAVTALSLLVALGLSAWLQRIVTRPLRNIVTVAGRVVEERDYSLRAHKTTSDEFGVVIDAFNNMLSEVQSRTRALEESNASLRNEIAIRHAAEEALARSERLYRAIGESIDYGVWVADENGGYVYVSDSFLRLVGMTQEQCSGLGWANALHPDERDTTLEAWQECVRSGRTWYREHWVRGVNGDYHPVLAQGVPIVNAEGHITGWAGINLDIRRIKQTEAALIEADRRKDEFLATLAHELRNPLAPIRHATRILDTPAATEQQKQWSREVIARQVQHMALLLDDLLDISRITRGRLTLKKECVSLEKLIAAAVETARPLIEAKQHELSVALPHEPVGLYVDSLRMSQALSNILTNAAKYTDPGGRIALSAAVDGDGIAIAVRDTGIGLSEAALTHVFDMFSQVDSALERSQGGLGIGLALVQGLVALHGGTVEATSPGVGQGSTFTIRLTRTSLARPVASPGISRVGTLTGRDAKCRILIADDNRDAADSLALILRVSGHEVVVAYSGTEAIALALQTQPPVIILDIGMPGLSGYEMAERLRHEAWARRALLIAVTGWGQREDKERARLAGFDHHFTKPVDAQELDACIASFLRTNAGVIQAG